MIKKAVLWTMLVGTIALVVAAGLQASVDEAKPVLTDSEMADRNPKAAAEASAAPSNCGDVNSNGTITSSDVISLVNYVFKSGAAPLCPDCNLAWGAVNTTGTTLNPGSGNWTCVWNAASLRYEITITGESYFYASYHASVTPYGSTSATVTTDSNAGKLVVTIYDAAGTKIQRPFSFAVNSL